MATHIIEVQIGTTQLPDTEANQQRLFVFSGTNPIGASTGNIGGNIGAKVNPARNGMKHFALNSPRIPATITVSSFQPQKYDSNDLKGQPSLVNQLADMIEKGYIEIVDEAAPGVPLDRQDLTALL